jgi:serine phosphatase RsbU (regulator of sigma subunit)
MEHLLSELRAVQRRELMQRARIRRLNDELRLAASLQRNLQSPPPVIDGVDIHTLYRPADVVSGDMVDAVRLDESCVAVELVDATGHGLSAGLLAAFVKRSLRGKEVTGRGYRLLEPDEVLTRVNHDILDTQLEECQFVTAVYAVYNEQTGIIRWARGGAPYPILVRPHQPPQRLISGGPLLGILPDATFEIVELRLEPGDTLVFHTDGLDTILPDTGSQGDSRGLDQTDWVQELDGRSLAGYLKELGHRLDSMAATAHARDDVTVVALHVADPGPTRHRAQLKEMASPALCPVG